MNAFEDARVDHVRGRIREAGIRARLLHRRRIGGGHREAHFIGPKEQGKSTDCGSGDVVGTRGVIWIIGSIDQRLPIRVTDGFGIAIVVAFLNTRNGSPKDVVALAVKRGDHSIGHRQVS